MPASPTDLQGLKRLHWLYVGLILLGVAMVLRLSYLQISRHGHYAALAAKEHQTKTAVPADRGQIYLLDGDTKVPLALDQSLKLLYADPSIITDKPGTAAKLAAVTGDSQGAYLAALNNGTEYAQLKGRVDSGMAGRIKALNLRGIGFKNQDYRTYPEGNLASQVLGFVNDTGDGQYGIEGYLNKDLKGRAGQLNAKTDTNGVPIATADNIDKAPVSGDSVVLTIDRNVQAQAEKYLSDGVKNVHAESGSAIVLDPATGAVKAMANYPSFDPNNYRQVKDYRTFSNAVVTNQFEPGSVFKVITMAAGLDAGKITPASTYTDNGCEQIDNYKVCNAENHHEGPNTTMTVVLRDSLNTGVMYVERLLAGDPNTISAAAKKVYYGYVTGHFGFGRPTGIEQAGEADGNVNPPTSNNVNYANMAFGQGISVTMLQMATAVGAIANGGKLYRPYVVDRKIMPDGTESATKPTMVNSHAISAKAATDLTGMMEVVVQHGSGYKAFTPGYRIAGKTGTAQIANPNGPGYLENQNIGTFVGFAPAEDPKFVVMVRINKPQTQGFAETTTVPVFTNLTRWLLQYYAVPPSS